MPQGFSLDLSGLKQVQKAIENINSEASKGIADEMNTAVLNIQRDAKRTAPANLGKLRQSIQIDNNNTLFKSVYSSVNYAPYVEFGTRKNVQIPDGYEAFAAQYKSAGGQKTKDFYEAIKFWVQRKGIDPKLTYVIFRSIMRNGIKPQPFMVPAFEREKPKLLKRLKKLFK